MQEDELVRSELQIRTEALRGTLRQLAKAFSEVFGPFLESAAETFNELWEYAKKAAETLEQNESDKRKKQLQYKIDFSRPMIQHQVIDRRPRLIRKIIR